MTISQNMYWAFEFWSIVEWCIIWFNFNFIILFFVFYNETPYEETWTLSVNLWWPIEFPVLWPKSVHKVPIRACPCLCPEYYKYRICLTRHVACWTCTPLKRKLLCFLELFFVVLLPLFFNIFWDCIGWPYNLMQGARCISLECWFRGGGTEKG